MEALKGNRLRVGALIALATVSTCAAARTETAAGFFSLRMGTVRAFDEYLAKTEARNARTKDGHFLWPDDFDETQREEAYGKLKSGEVEIRRVAAVSADVPGGLIHDWKGIVFIPGAKLDDVLGVLQDYNEHAKYYAPDVERAKIEERDGNHFRVFMRFRRHQIITVVLNTEQDVNYYRDSGTKAHSRSSATRIAQVEKPGTAAETEKTPGNDDGYLWRMETWWRMEERNGGVYVQNEVLTLTRDIPVGLGWLIEPFISSIPRKTLEFTLEATRKAVVETKGH